jgi:3'(2'), 5'-bisphosphate nucleotidase
MDYSRELEAALEAAERAGRQLLDEYRRFEVIADAPADITTEADRQAQETVLGHLYRTFPDDALCAEEATPTLAAARQTGRRMWVVDPIDGTRGFARKNGEFSVMIALMDDNRVAVGVVLEPAHQRLTYAARGHGCWRRDNGHQAVLCQVSGTSRLAEASLVQSHSKGPDKPSAQVKALAPARLVETYSAGIKMALVARGEVDLYVNNYSAFHDWDICAGDVLVSEAGGRVTELTGRPIRYGTEGAWQRGGMLASNAVLHDAALAAWKAAGGQPG